MNNVDALTDLDLDILRAAHWRIVQAVATLEAREEYSDLLAAIEEADDVLVDTLNQHEQTSAAA